MITTARAVMSALKDTLVRRRLAASLSDRFMGDPEQCYGRKEDSVGRLPVDGLDFLAVHIKLEIEVATTLDREEPEGQIDLC
jgi:hypothetical protein